MNHVWDAGTGFSWSCVKCNEAREVIHHWDSADNEDRFDCGMKVQSHMRWDIRPLTSDVLVEHREFESQARFCRSCLEKKGSG